MRKTTEETTGPDGVATPTKSSKDKNNKTNKKSAQKQHHQQQAQQRSPSLLSSTSSSSLVASSLSLSQHETTTPPELAASTTRSRLLDNEMRSFKNRAFHDGYDEAKGAVLQEAFDSSYKKAFEQNFILSTLKGVASALKTSGFSSNSVSVNISSNHLSLLDSMKFDGSGDIESIKKDLITICRENRLEILAHYVSQIG